MITRRHISVSHSGDDSSVDVWYTNKSLLLHNMHLFASGPYAEQCLTLVTCRQIQKQCMVTGQGLPLCLHCVLSVIQSHHLHFTRSETLSWPTTGGHCLSFCVCALTYFHFESAHVPVSVLLCWACALTLCVCMHVRPGSEVY